jgi:hypothetical protein
MKKVLQRTRAAVTNQNGMELEQIAMIVGIALIVGFIFREQIVDFVEGIFDGLDSSDFQD